MIRKTRTIVAVFLAAFSIGLVAESVLPAASQAWPRPYGPVIKAQCDELAREIMTLIPEAASIRPGVADAAKRRLEELGREWDRLGCSSVLHAPVAIHEITADSPVKVIRPGGDPVITSAG